MSGETISGSWCLPDGNVMVRARPFLWLALSLALALLQSKLAHYAAGMEWRRSTPSAPVDNEDPQQCIEGLQCVGVVTSASA